MNDAVKPCVKCGGTDRYAGGRCRPCNVARDAAYREANREKIAARDAAYYTANTEKMAARDAANREKIKARYATPAGKAKHRARQAAYRDTPKGKAARRAQHATRRAAKLRATPPWPEPWNVAAVTAGWWKLASPGWHSDHIIPLKGKTVWGLHVPWNIQHLPGPENVAKGNRFDQDAVNAEYLAVIQDRQWDPQPIKPAKRRSIPSPS